MELSEEDKEIINDYNKVVHLLWDLADRMLDYDNTKKIIDMSRSLMDIMIDEELI